MKIIVKCHHLFIDGKRVDRGQEVDASEHNVNGILLADKAAGRTPRIELLEVIEPKKPATKTVRRRKRVTKSEDS